MTELTDRLKKQAQDIWKQSDEFDDKHEAMRCRTYLLKQIDIKERWMVQPYVEAIGRERRLKAIRGLHRGDTAVAIDKGNMDGGGG